jgi:hypothetical protein
MISCGYPSAQNYQSMKAAEEPKSARWFSDFVSKDDLYRTSPQSGCTRRAAQSMQHVHITSHGGFHSHGMSWGIPNI